MNTNIVIENICFKSFILVAISFWLNPAGQQPQRFLSAKRRSMDVMYSCEPENAR